MFNYIAYTYGGTTCYPVTQIRKEGTETFVAFNSEWHNKKDCIVCVGSGCKDVSGEEIFDGDIIQLTAEDHQCRYKNQIGVVTYIEGKFVWRTDSYYPGYELAGKSWRRLGNVATDMEKYFSTQQILQSRQLTELRDKLRGNFNGVMIEKFHTKGYMMVKGREQYSAEPPAPNASKSEKKLIHQYKNYLKIKSYIQDGTIDTELLEENMKHLKL